MTQNKQIHEFVKKLEPKLTELVQQKLKESRSNSDTMNVNQLTLDVTEKMKEWLNLKENQLGTQLEIEVIISLTSRLVLLWYALDNTVKRTTIPKTEVIGG